MRDRKKIPPPSGIAVIILNIPIISIASFVVSRICLQLNTCDMRDSVGANMLHQMLSLPREFALFRFRNTSINHECPSLEELEQTQSLCQNDY